MVKHICIKIVDKTQADLVAEAEGELEGAGFEIVYREEGEWVRVDAVKHGGGEEVYRDAAVIIGQKES